MTVSEHATTIPAQVGPPVTTEQIVGIAQDVWSSLLGLELVEVGVETIEGRSVTGCVTINGAWQGSVQLRAPESVARTAAAAMFMMAEDELSEAEIGDALGELTNMIGGNIKSLLPEPSRLSLPSVTEGLDHTTRVCGASLVTEVALTAGAGALHIALWRV